MGKVMVSIMGGWLHGHPCGTGEGKYEKIKVGCTQPVELDVALCKVFHDMHDKHV